MAEGTADWMERETLAARDDGSAIAPRYFSKDELRRVYGHLSRLLPPGPRPLASAEEVLEVQVLLAKAQVLIESGAGEIARGRKIFEWRLPKADAPTQNEIRGFVYRNPFIMDSIAKRVDKSLHAILDTVPGARVHGRVPRWVRVTRFTPLTGAVDDPTAIDALGGKVAVDALVRARVLVDDRPEFCRREGHVRKTKQGNVHVLVEVFEAADEELPDPGPLDAPVEQRKKRGRRGAVAQHVVDASGGEAPKRPRKRKGVIAQLLAQGSGGVAPKK